MKAQILLFCRYMLMDFIFYLNQGLANATKIFKKAQNILWEFLKEGRCQIDVSFWTDVTSHMEK